METCVVVLSILLAVRACSAAEPSGEFVELHSCDLYTGGCTASSEATLLGRQLFSVWSIERGGWAGRDLAGVKIALLEAGSKNLAEKGAVADQAEVFMPKGLAPDQKEALLSWLKTERPLPISTSVVDADVSYSRTGEKAEVSVGDIVVLSTASIGKCSSGACGQAVWYEPKANYSTFAVASSRTSMIRNARLHLVWWDHDRPNVFLATFGNHADPLADSTSH
jgi:hypothetical protein